MFGAVGLNRLDADHKHVGDRLRGVALGDELGNLGLARRERPLQLLGCAGLLKLLAQLRGERRGVDEGAARIAARQASTMSLSAARFAT